MWDRGNLWGRRVAGLAPVALACATGCGGAAGPEEGPEPFPDVFRLAGKATAAERVGGTLLTAECHLDILVDLRIPAPGQTEPGRFSGEAARTVLRPDGSGLGLFADLAGAARIRHPTPDSVEIFFPENTGDSGSRFWDSLAVLGGRLGGPDLATGRWVCAPFDLDRGDFADTAVTAIGSWNLERWERSRVWDAAFEGAAGE